MLNGWKEIAVYLGRGVRTVQRWESLGLPIRRPHGRARSCVIAFPDELEGWVHATPLRPADPVTWLKNRVAELEAEVVSLRTAIGSARPRIEVSRQTPLAPSHLSAGKSALGQSRVIAKTA